MSKEISAPDGKKFVAIYDNLKAKFPSSWILKNMEGVLVAEGITSARMFSLGQYPYCIEMKDASDAVSVEVYEMSEDGFEAISAYYCHPFVEYLSTVYGTIKGERVALKVSIFMLEGCIGGVKIVPGVWTLEMAGGK